MSPAPFERRRLTVADAHDLGSYRVLSVADGDTPEPRPGQFSMLAACERWGGEDGRPYLPRAFSIARRAGGESHYLLEDVGPGTRRLCELGPGDELWSLGPLGRGFDWPHDGRRALLLGGGAGIAPLAILQDALRARAGGGGGGVGESPRGPAAAASPAGAASPAETVLVGFRDRAHTDGARLLHDARLATDDGSVGHHGPVTELLAAELDRDPHAVVYACGPVPMLEAVRAICSAREIPAQLALESPMACGFGACFGCVVPRRGGGYLRVCLDGPVIDAHALERLELPAAGQLVGNSP